MTDNTSNGSERTDDRAKRRLSRRSLLAGTGAAAAATFAGCSGLNASNGSTSTTTTTTTRPKNELQFSKSSAPVGGTVTVSGSGLPANSTLDIEWQRVRGQWQVVQHKTIGEAQYTTSFEKHGTVTTDGSGAFSTKLSVPEDHGGKHEVRVTANGKSVATGTFRVERTYSLESNSVPLGEEFTVKLTGMKYSRYRRVDQILWDSGFAGYITATTTRGTARIKIPAAGPPGKHVLEVSGGHMSPYLNPQQSPYPRDPRLAQWTVTVEQPTMSPGDHWKRPQISETPIEAFYPKISNPSGSLNLSDTSGIVGSTTTVEGSGFGANESVSLKWASMSGSRVTNGGFEKKYTTLETATTNSSGAFSKQVTIPDDLGGTHPIVAEVGGQKKAVTGFVVQPSLVDFGPKKAPLGTKCVIHFKGVGWTEADNAYAAMYDNDYMGYACGFNTGGDVKIQFEASGEPGYHSVNCFPMLYKKPVQKRKDSFWNRPQLTYLDDHPIRTPPAFGFLFEVTKS